MVDKDTSCPQHREPAGDYRYRVVAGANAGRASVTSGTLRLRVLRG